MDVFRIRLNCVDHYQSQPTEFDPQLFGPYGSTQQKDAPQVPVIRVFGATESGQKVCAHIHGALPYLFIEYQGSLEPEDGKQSMPIDYVEMADSFPSVKSYIQNLRASIDHALATSYRRNLYDGKAVFVGHITLVKGIPFFGYHVGYRFFLKIYMLNPLHMTRFTDLLHSGAIMNQALQPFESHLQYLAQWMCDFNLYGCSYIDCKAVKFRGPVPEHSSLKNESHKWHDESITPAMILNPDRYPRQSHCSIEIDICVKDILNRQEMAERNLHYDFVERFNPVTADEKLVHSLAGLWKDETRRRKLRMGIKDPSSSPFGPEAMAPMSADPRSTEKGGWIHEEEFRELVKGLVEEEKSSVNMRPVQFDDFVKPDEREVHVQTVFQSVEDLFPTNLQRCFLSNQTGITDTNAQNELHPTEVPIDEIEIPTFNGCDFPDLLGDDHDNRDDSVERELTRGIDSGAVDSSPCEKQLDSLQTVHNREDGGQNSIGDVSTSHTREATDSAVGNHSQARDSSFGLYSKETPNISIEDGQLLTADNSHHSTKRRRISLTGFSDVEPHELESLQEEQSEFPRSRRVKFDLADDTSKPVFAKPSRSPEKRTPSPQKRGLSPQRRQDLGSAPSSQLSQTSIKANALKPSFGFSFPVVKNPYTSRSSQDVKPKEDYTPASLSSAKSTTVDHTAPSSPLTVSTKSPSIETSSQALRLAQSISTEFPQHHIQCFWQVPPSHADVETSMFSLGLPPVIYQDAYYSDEKDVPERARDYAGRGFKLESNTVPYLAAFDPTGTSAATFGEKPAIVIDGAKEEIAHERRRRCCGLRNWEILEAPPTRVEVEHWLKGAPAPAGKDPSLEPKASAKTNPESRIQDGLSQIEGPTQKNKHGFKFTQKQSSTSVKHETQYMSTMSLELHINSRESLAPNPEHDEVNCIFWCLLSDNDEVTSNGTAQGTPGGVLVLSPNGGLAQKFKNQIPFDVEEEETELDLLNRMVDIVRQHDPDILTGYEVHNGSWGYLIERARLKYEFNLCDEFSRVISQSHGRFGKESDRWGFNHTSTIRVTGRHMVNIWRAMRGELNLLQYTMENVTFHLLHKRIPHYSFRDLTSWYTSSEPRDVVKCIVYFVSRVQINLEILQANELIPRTSEQARLIGVDFFSVFSRGSQFKVESFMFRIAKPENFLLPSPSRKQVGGQNALECLPLVMEPQSAFYNSPLLVLDFQSLYPSIMIAYNFCYSTCLGRIVNWRGQNKMGFADFKRQPRLLELVKDHINISPNGMMYVKPEMRKSLLAKMLGEILETRVMVKSGMKVDKQDKTLQQLLNNRQLALKLLANVTYGYTSASFSGRMPCSEIADSIVQTARETLEKAIAYIHSVKRWGAEVVYGDTDSLFIYLKGRTKDQAFDIGEEIAKAITDMNPRPVKLKFEKVYFPCILLAKKRYVGFKYESKSQTEPEFDAKGIETVRRDGTPAEQKLEEKALKILFRSADLSQVKSYFQRQCTKVMLGKVSIQDFCFAREVKLGTYSDRGPPPPGALISTRRMLEDPRLEPQYGERVPYVVITGAPGARLIDRCVAPEHLLKEEGGELDAEYYILKNLIPPLERIFNLVGANVRQWFDEMPKVQRIRDLNAMQNAGNGMIGALIPLKKTLESYMRSSNCLVCRSKLPALPASDPANKPVTPLCEACLQDAPISLFKLMTRLRDAQRKAADVESVCRSCSGIASAEEVRCDSKDCPVFYSRIKARAKERRVKFAVESVTFMLEQEELDF